MTAPATLIAQIADSAAALAAADSAVVEHAAERDALIRQALQTGLPRAEIAAAAGLGPARLYQIRDGRR
jgi:hypothetical protein